jgi:hypothetical protein
MIQNPQVRQLRQFRMLLRQMTSIGCPPAHASRLPACSLHLSGSGYKILVLESLMHQK